LKLRHTLCIYLCTHFAGTLHTCPFYDFRSALAHIWLKQSLRRILTMVRLIAVATYFAHIRGLRRDKWRMLPREHRERWRSEISERTVRREQGRRHRHSLSRCTDHKACRRTSRLEQLSLGRRSSARPRSCPDDVLHSSANRKLTEAWKWKQEKKDEKRRR